MCARILKHVPEEKQGKFYHASQLYFDRIIAFYGKTLQWVLKRQTATLIVVRALRGAKAPLFHITIGI